MHSIPVGGTNATSDRGAPLCVRRMPNRLERGLPLRGIVDVDFYGGCVFL